MRIRSFGVLALLCALIIPITANRAIAQSSEKPAQYTYVSEWGVPRAMWGDYLKGEAADTELMKKGMADGVITGFGSYAVLNHQEGGMTHGTWFNATSIANLLKFLEILRNAPGATDAPLAAAKHADYILQSHEYADHAGTFNNGILRVGRWAPRAGSSDPDGKIVKATMVSLRQLLCPAPASGVHCCAEMSATANARSPMRQQVPLRLSGFRRSNEHSICQ